MNYNKKAVLPLIDIICVKKAWNIIWRVLLAALLTVYVGVALLNYSMVQSVIGSAVGRHLSAEWGGEVKIGSLHANPFNHLIANNLLLVAPDGDTILDAETLQVHFKRFPFHDNKLAFSRIYLRNAYYHLAVYSIDAPEAPDYVRNMPRDGKQTGTNLQYIFNHYANWERKKIDSFTVDVGEAVLNHVHYKMDLPEHKERLYENGVDVPHMEFYDIRTKITKVHVVNDDVSCRLVRFCAEERSGFKVNDIAAQVHVGQNDITAKQFKVETDHSVVKADVEITYDCWESLNQYVFLAEHDITIDEGTSVALADVAYWVPALWGKEIQLMPAGNVVGTVDKMHTDGMSLRFGNASEIAVEGSVSALTTPKFMVADIDDLTVRFEESDLRQICDMMPQYITPKVAHLLKEIAYIDLSAKGKWDEYHENSTANLYLVCGLGNLRADASVKAGKSMGGRRVLLHADSDGMGLTPLGSDWLTHSGFTLDVDADLPKNIKNLRAIEAEATADLTGSVVKGNNLDPIHLHAYMNGGKLDFAASCDDSLFNADLHGNAKLADDERVYSAHLDLNCLQADTFGLMKPEYGRIATHIDANFKGNSLDALRGALTATGTRVGKLKLHELTLSVTPDDEEHKNLRLESDALTATVGGRFAYADLPVMLQHVCHEVLPEDLGLVAVPDSAALAAIDGNTLNFHLRLVDSTLLSQALPNLSLASGTRIDGTYNSSDLLRLVARSSKVRLGSVILSHIGLSSNYASDRSYGINIESADIKVGDLTLFDDIQTFINSCQDSASVQLQWGDFEQPSRGGLKLTLDHGDIRVSNPRSTVDDNYFYIDDTPWRIAIDSLHLEPHPRPTLAGHGIRLESENQRIEGRLRLLRQENDCVELDFNNFDLTPLCELILQESPISLGGSVDGRFSLYGLAATPYFNANLTVDSCILNRQELGTLAVRSNWNAEMNTLNLLVHGNTLRANGWLGLGNEDPDLNFSVGFNQFELASIAPLLATFSSRFEGQLEGELDIDGTLSKPNVVGEAYINGGALKVDPTGVTYYFNDSIQFTNNLVTLDRFKLLDQSGNIATVDGTIGYNGLDNIRLDLRLNTDNLMVLNQRSGEQFYGTMLVQADGQIRGTAEALDITVHARTNPGSTLTVPVSDRRQVQSQDFITFVGSTDNTDAEQKQSKTSAMDFNLEVDLAITPDVLLNLPMDFSEVNVGVRGSGSGDLHMSLDNRMEPQVMGNYEITSGTLKLSFISLLEKTFSLEPGSNLNFQGSLPDARFDLQAVYAQRVNLSTLTGGYSAIDNTEKYIQVEDIIAINGTLNEPTISFDLRLPNADASIEEEIFAYIDRNSERDMLNQTVSLLLLGQFYNANGTMNENTDLLGSGLSSGYSMVASKMGSMVSDMVNIVDVDFKYKAATELTNEQVDVNISKDWGRWYLESTLGYGGDSRELESNANGNAVIDALLGYRITPMIHVYAYNRTNNNDYTRIDLPYKQGAGLKLTKDFDRWGDLFIRKKKK